MKWLKLRNQKIAAILAAVSIVMLTGCSSAKTVQEPASNQETTGYETEVGQNTSDVSESQEEKTADTVGTFNTTDILGTAYTEKIFEDSELTMVNVFTTWCTPCVEELPELEKLYQAMKGKGVKVVGIVMDTVNENGKQDQEIIEKAKVLKERTGVTYPLLIPDAANLNGRLSGINSYPETFFVDKDGNIVGESYNGSGGMEDWKEVVENELANLERK